MPGLWQNLQPPEADRKEEAIVRGYMQASSMPVEEGMRIRPGVVEASVGQSRALTESRDSICASQGQPAPDCLCNSKDGESWNFPIIHFVLCSV